MLPQAFLRVGLIQKAKNTRMVKIGSQTMR